MKAQVTQLAVWASGSGSNAENLADYFQDAEDARVSLILTNKSDAGVIDRAQRLGIPCQVFTNAEFAEGTSVLHAMQAAGIEWIILGGFLRMVPQKVIAAYPGRIVNIHPALLPNFGGPGMYGSRVHRAVVAAGVTESGITIHEVNEEYDEGQILFQVSCPVEPSDKAEDVEKKVRALEQRYYPEVVASLIRK